VRLFIAKRRISKIEFFGLTDLLKKTDGYVMRGKRSLLSVVYVLFYEITDCIGIGVEVGSRFYEATIHNPIMPPIHTTYSHQLPA